MKTLFKQLSLWILIFNSTAYGVASKGLHNFSDSTEFAVKSTLPAASMETGFSSIAKEKQLNNGSKIRRFWNQHRGAIIVGGIITAVSAAIIIKMCMYNKKMVLEIFELHEEVYAQKDEEKKKLREEMEKQITLLNSRNQALEGRERDLISQRDHAERALRLLKKNQNKKIEILEQQIKEKEAATKTSAADILSLREQIGNLTNDISYLENERSVLRKDNQNMRMQIEEFKKQCLCQAKSI